VDDLKKELKHIHEELEKLKPEIKKVRSTVDDMTMSDALYRPGLRKPSSNLTLKSCRR
jgi:hypothetical protein